MTYANYKIDPCLGYWAVRATNFVLGVVDFFLSAIFGYSIRDGSSAERKRARQYEHSAHIVNIYARGSYGIFDIPRLNRHFVHTHHSYVHPKYVLENDNVTLMGSTTKSVFFSVAPPQLDLSNVKVFPFLWMGQFLGSHQLIEMSHENFHKLAEEETPKPDHINITLIHMTARCGSTLLSTMLERVPKVRVLSEPLFDVFVQQLALKRLLSEKECNRLVRNAFKIICKRLKTDADVTHLIYKTNCFGANYFPELMRAYPDVKIIFNTRLISSSIYSLLKIVEHEPKFYTRYTNVFARMWLWMQPIAHKSADLRRQLDRYTGGDRSNWSQVDKIAFGAATMYIPFMENRARYAAVVYYEDINKDSRNTMEKLFKVLGLPMEHVDKALQALKVDSQQGVLGARGKSKQAILPEMWVNIDRIFKEVGVDASYEQTVDEMRAAFDIK